MDKVMSWDQITVIISPTPGVSRGTNKAVFVALPVIKHVTDKIRAYVLYRWVVSVFLLFCLLTSENYYPEWPITKNAYYRLKGANILGDL